MAGKAGRSLLGRWGVHLAVLAIVIVWTLPTMGILVSSLRDRDQIIVSGWWSAMSGSEQTEAGRLADPSTQVGRDGLFVIEGRLFEEDDPRRISAFGTRATAPTATEAGGQADLGDGATLTV